MTIIKKYSDSMDESPGLTFQDAALREINELRAALLKHILQDLADQAQVLDMGYGTTWVDVNLALPSEDGMLVVVLDPTNEPTVWPAKWDANAKTFASDGGWFELDEVTHWMRLPKAPQPENANEPDRAST